MKKILLVDDTKETFQMIHQSVSELAEVTWVTCLQEASTILTETKFSLIILDVDLPDGNGIEFGFTLMPSLPKTPVLFLASNQALADKQDAPPIWGGDMFVTKPFSPSALRERVQVLESGQEMTDLWEMYLIG